jgi:hypothetical protein
MPINTPTDIRVREDRLLRAAQRQELMLRKSPRRDPRALGYGLWAIIDPDTGGTMHSHAPWGIHVLTLDEVEAYLLGDDDE